MNKPIANYTKVHFFYALCFVLVLLFNSCFTVPCSIYLKLSSQTDTYTVYYMSSEKEEKFSIQENQEVTIDLSKDGMTNPFLLVIEGPKLFKAYSVTEYDHWFPIKHVISIKVINANIVLDKGKLNIDQIAETRETLTEYFKTNKFNISFKNSEYLSN